MRTALNFLYRFMTDGIPLICVSVPIVVLFRMIYHYLRRRDRLTDTVKWDREYVVMCFAVFLTLLYTQTFIVNEGVNEINLVPFRIIAYEIRYLGFSADTFRIFVLNIVGNIAVFVPVGLFCAFLTGGSFSKTTASGFGISLMIEAGQIPLNRTSDVDDLILNTTGAIVGFLIYTVYAKLRDIIGRQRR